MIQSNTLVHYINLIIIAPTEFHSDYYNRKGWFSMIIQEVADHKYRFIDVYTGWPGSVHDASVFANSPIYKKGIEGRLFNGLKKSIGSKDVPVCLLGDSAYPLKSWLLKPFPHNGLLTRSQQLFNYRLSKARIVIENTFGQLKGRWRCLIKRLDAKPENTPIIIMACCILHNVCETHSEFFDSEWSISTNEYSQPEDIPTGSGNDETQGSSIRNILIDYFINEQ